MKRKGETRDEYNSRMREYFAEHRRKNRERINKVQNDRYHERMQTDPEYAVHRRKENRKFYFGRPDSQRPRTGVCELCGDEHDGTKGPRDLLFQDHDHETGALRGMLCTKCNNGIGALGDNVSGLERALAYLRKHAQ